MVANRSRNSALRRGANTERAMRARRKCRLLGLTCQSGGPCERRLLAGAVPRAVNDIANEQVWPIRGLAHSLAENHGRCLSFAGANAMH
jgi:hypothetical protein